MIPRTPGKHISPFIVSIVVSLLLASCGDQSGNGSLLPDGATPDGQSDGPAGCVPGAAQCNNCIDDDGDGDVDGFDVACTGILDNDESSFATGISGDNIDAVQQDCFFDGNSGAGNDGCNIHVCCLLDECPPDLNGPTFDPASCQSAVTELCRDTCFPLTPPGCDCFGCCTICDDAGCATVLTNPAVAPDCTEDSLHDDTKCLTCTPSPDCTQPCGGGTCVLCPGQDASDLPSGCDGALCPGGADTCSTTADCPAGDYCSNGCCIVGIS